jgi:hypothetical protein
MPHEWNLIDRLTEETVPNALEKPSRFSEMIQRVNSAFWAGSIRHAECVNHIPKPIAQNFVDGFKL